MKIILITLFYFLIAINITYAESINNKNDIIIEVKNSAILKDILDTNIYHLSGLEKYQLIKNSDDIIIILRNGTEIQRLNKTQSLKFILDNKNIFDQQNSIDYKERLISPKFNFTDIKIFNSWQNVLKLGEWNWGTCFDINSSLGSSNISVGGVDFSISHFQKYRFLYVGAKYQNITFLGSLNDTVNQINYRTQSNNIIGFSFAIPFVKYSFEYNSVSLPQFYWLQDSTLDHFLENTPGDLIRDLNDTLPDSYSSNIVHTLKFKIGYLTFTNIIDNDTYSSNITIIALENMPAIFGHWGMGIIKGKYLAYPILTATFDNLIKTKIKINDKIGAKIKLSPFNLFLAYKSKTNFTLSVGTNLKFYWSKQ